MRRRFLLGGLTVVFAAALALTVIRCDPPPTKFTSFSYIPHELPRVFVSHHPLRARPSARTSTVVCLFSRLPPTPSEIVSDLPAGRPPVTAAAWPL